MNYLGEAAERIIERVGFRGNPQAQREPQGQRGEGVDDPIDNYSYNSGLSAPGTTTLLAAGTDTNQRGGEKIMVRTNSGGTTPYGKRATSPTSSATMTMPTTTATSQEWGGGGDQGTLPDEGQPHNEQGQGAPQGPGGGNRSATQDNCKPP